MKMMMFISEEKRGSKKAAMRKQVNKERKYKTNCLSYLDYLDQGDDNMFSSYNEYINYLVKILNWPEDLAKKFAEYAWQFKKNKEEN